MAAYAVMTILSNTWQRKFQKKYLDAKTENCGKEVDGLLNYETVKYYGKEQYELDRFKKYVKEKNVRLKNILQAFGKFWLFRTPIASTRPR